MHQLAEHRCAFCRLVGLDGMRGDASVPDDVVYRDGTVTAFIASVWWPSNHGHVLVVLNEHYENVYLIPDDLLTAVQLVGKRVTTALKETYACDVVSFRRHNEPAGSLVEPR